MKYKDFVTSFVRSWNFTRSETLEILNSLTNTQLKFKPKGKKWQTMAWQFACIGRTQLVYAQAIKSGFMDFSLFHSEEMPQKTDFTTKEELLEFLKKCDKEWIEAIRSRRMEEEFVVVWPGFKKSLPVHITGLVSHERLHHGELIAYFTLAGIELPENFKSNWAL